MNQLQRRFVDFVRASNPRIVTCSVDVRNAISEGIELGQFPERTLFCDSVQVVEYLSDDDALRGAAELACRGINVACVVGGKIPGKIDS